MRTRNDDLDEHDPNDNDDDDDVLLDAANLRCAPRVTTREIDGAKRRALNTCVDASAVLLFIPLTPLSQRWPSPSPRPCTSRVPEPVRAQPSCRCQGVGGCGGRVVVAVLSAPN